MADIAELVARVRDEGVTAATRNVERLEAGFTRAEARTVSLDSAINLLARSYDILSSFAGSVVGAAAEQQSASAALTAQLESQERWTADLNASLEAQASAMQGVTRFGDDMVLSAQTIAATFPNLSDDIIPRVIEQSADLATVFGMGLPEAARNLSMALNDPAEALTRLARIGVRFSDDEKKVIERMVETGRTAEAQGLILDELGRRFGGRALADARTFAGQMDILRNEFGELAEAAGSIIVESGAVEGVFGNLKDAIVGLATETRDYIEANREIIDAEIESFFADLPQNISDAKTNLESLSQSARSFASSLKPIFDFVKEHPEVAAGIFLGARMGGVGGAAALGGLGLVAETSRDTGVTPYDLLLPDRGAQRRQTVPYFDEGELVERSRAAEAKFKASLSWEMQRRLYPEVELDLGPGGESTEGAGGFTPMMGSAPPGAIAFADPYGQIPRRKRKSGFGGGGGTGDAETDKELQAFANKVIADTATPLEAFDEFKGKLEAAFAAGKISAEVYTRALGEATQELLMGKEAADAYQKALDTVRAEGVALYQETRTEAEKYAEEVARINALAESIDPRTSLPFIDADTQTRALTKLREEYESTAQAMRDSVRPAEALDRALAKINETAAAHPEIITPEIKTDLVEKTIEDFNRDGDEKFDELIQATEGFGRDFSRSFAEWTAGARVSWRELLQGLVTDINEMVFHQGVTQPVLGFVQELIFGEEDTGGERGGFKAAKKFGGGLVGGAGKAISSWLFSDDPAPSTGNGGFDGTVPGSGGFLDTADILDFLSGTAQKTVAGDAPELDVEGIGEGFFDFLDELQSGTSELFGGLSNMLTNLFSSIFGDGGFDIGTFFTKIGTAIASSVAGNISSGGDFGDVTSGGSSTAAAAHDGALIRRYHSGGVAGRDGGLRYNEVPAILEAGELVIDKETTPALLALIGEIEDMARRGPAVRRFHDGGMVELGDRTPAQPLADVGRRGEPGRNASGGGGGRQVVVQQTFEIPVTLAPSLIDSRGIREALQGEARTVVDIVRDDISRAGRMSVDVGQRGGFF